MNRQQLTTRFPVVLEGVGVHSNQKTKITLKPAGIDEGVYFVHEGQRIPASLDQVKDTRFCTVLGDRGQIVTIEHLLAAIMGAGLDNLKIEVEGREIPIFDGSAYDFFFALQAAGREILEAPRRFLTLKEAVRLELEDGRFCALSPAEDFSLSFRFHALPSACLKGVEEAHFSFASQSFEHELARARTFGFLADHPKLLAMGLAQGSSLANTLVFDERGVVNLEGLRFYNEAAKHKVLDAVGDLALLGLRLKMRFEGHGSGHAMHYQLMLKAQPFLQVESG